MEKEKRLINRPVFIFKKYELAVCLHFSIKKTELQKNLSRKIRFILQKVHTSLLGLVANDIQLPERIIGGRGTLPSFTNCLASGALEDNWLSHGLTIEVECGSAMTLS